MTSRRCASICSIVFSVLSTGTLFAVGCVGDESTSDDDGGEVGSNDGSTGEGSSDGGMQCRASWEAALQEAGMRCSATAEGDCALSECSISSSREANADYLDCLDAADLPPDDRATTTPCREACLDVLVACLALDDRLKTGQWRSAQNRPVWEGAGTG